MVLLGVAVLGTNEEKARLWSNDGPAAMVSGRAMKSKDRATEVKRARGRLLRHVLLDDLGQTLLTARKRCWQ